MRSVGMLPVVVHGGGPQIGELMARLGKVPEFRDGMRVTDAETLEIARMVLIGKVNREIVSAMNVHGSLAVGLSGEDAKMITATARDAALGFVGDVEVVDPSILQRLLAEGHHPGGGHHRRRHQGPVLQHQRRRRGRSHRRRPARREARLPDRRHRAARRPRRSDSMLRRVSVDELDAMVASGAASSGMIPKVEACARAVRAGVPRAHILDGRVPHALLLEMFSDRGVGTMIFREGEVLT